MPQTSRLITTATNTASVFLKFSGANMTRPGNDHSVIPNNVETGYTRSLELARHLPATSTNTTTLPNDKAAMLLRRAAAESLISAFSRTALSRRVANRRHRRRARPAV